MAYRFFVFIACLVLFAPLAMGSPPAEEGSGTVVEVIDVDSYLYVRLAEGSTWLAVRPTAVKAGDRVTYTGGSLMKDFHSRTLDRTFEYVVFAGALAVDAASANPHDTGAPHPPVAGHSGQPKPTATAPAAGEIAPAEGGRTIAQIFDQVEQLADQEVTLRGRVMKVSSGILGRNWITLQDGTGTEPRNRLIVTSDQVAEIGQLVTATGVLNRDVDLGMGYRYELLLEKANLSPSDSGVD